MWIVVWPWVWWPRKETLAWQNFNITKGHFRSAVVKICILLLDR